MDEENSELYDINIPKFIYNKLNQISEIYLKYISSYKSSTKDYIKDLKSIHKTYNEKMKEIKSECEKNKYFDLSLFFTILNSIPNINSSFVESLQFMINELEILVEKIQNGMKEKKIIYNKFLKNYNHAKNDLLIKMNELEKEKNNFLNNLSLSEKYISDFFENKLKIEDYSKDNNYVNNNEKDDLKNLFILNNNLEMQMEKSIKESQNIEKNYKSLISMSKLFKKAFYNSSNTTFENIKCISYDIIIDIKDFMQNIIILLKNCFSMPLKEIDSYLSKLIKNKEEFNKKFNIIFENIKEKINDQFVIEAKKYSLKVFSSKNKNHFIFEDKANDDNNYIDNDLDYLIAKTMLSSFTFLNEKYKINFELEDEKRATNKIMANILNNIKKNDLKNEKENNIDIKGSKDLVENNDNELKYVHENDIKQLYILLNKHHCRTVCLQSLNHFRILGKFCLSSKVYEIIGKCLLIIIDNIIKDEDYNMAKTVMILSETYYKIDEKNEKCYLHNIIKENKLFSNISFWEKILNISLKEEINRIKKIKNQNEYHIENKIEDNNIEVENIEKYNDIVFGQIIYVVNCMIDFGINKENIKKIIDPIIEEYKLNENHKQNINLVFQNQLNANINDLSNKINGDSNIENNKDDDKDNINNDQNKINIIKNDIEENKNENKNNNVDYESSEK